MSFFTSVYFVFISDCSCKHLLDFYNGRVNKLQKTDLKEQFRSKIFSSLATKTTSISKIYLATQNMLYERSQNHSCFMRFLSTGIM